MAMVTKVRGNDQREPFAIVVGRDSDGFTWVVRRADGRSLRGAACDWGSAQRSGAFAAAALEAFERISRRRF
jgi:hypothetical protein